MPLSLVTGAAGFIGSTLVDRLLVLGHGVVGVDSFEDYYPRALKEANLAGARRDPAFTLLEANLLDLALPADTVTAQPLRAALTRADYVFHLAAQAGVRASWGAEFETYTQNNVLATQVLLEATRSVSVRKLVCASSSSVYGDCATLPMRESVACRPISPYGVTKLAAEHLCSLYAGAFGVPTVSLRLFTVYGPRQRPDMAFHRFFKATAAGTPLPVFGDGAQTRDFTFVGDIVDAFVASLEAPDGSVMNIGGGTRITLRDAIETLLAVSGSEARLEQAARQKGDVQDTSADLSLARGLIGYSPKVGLREGLTREYEWLVESGLI
jgi:nucleoside-diphosphate-sugar epimerase